MTSVHVRPGPMLGRLLLSAMAVAVAGDVIAQTPPEPTRMIRPEGSRTGPVDLDALGGPDRPRLPYFAGNVLTRSYVEDLTRDTTRDLLLWADCSAGIALAESLDLDVVAPAAKGCLYLLFGVPASFDGKTYGEWVEYWLLDEPCAGAQSAACYLGFVIDTRIKNTTSARMQGVEQVVESRHVLARGEEIRARLVGREPAGAAIDPDRVVRPQVRPPAAAATARTATPRALDAAVVAPQIGSAQTSGRRTLATTLTVAVHQSILGPSRFNAEITIFDASGEQVGDTLHVGAIPSSQIGAAEDRCVTRSETAGATVDEWVGWAAYGAGAAPVVLAGGTAGSVAGAVGGAAAGAAIGGANALPGDQAVWVAAGAVAGGFVGGWTAAASAMPLANWTGNVADYVVGGGAGNLVELVVWAGCEAYAVATGRDEMLIVETEDDGGGGGGSSGGSVSPTAGNDEEDDEEEDKDTGTVGDEGGEDTGTETPGQIRRLGAGR